MKKLALVALFAVAAFGMAFAVETGTVAITGAVTESFSVVLPSAYTNGTISNDSDTTWAVGNVTVTSNVKNWTISLSSQNSGNLVLAGDTSETIPYTVALGSLITSTSLASIKTSAAQGRTAKAGNLYALTVLVPSSSSFYQSGTYSDTITVTISRP